MTHPIPAAESAVIIAALLQSARKHGINTATYRLLVRHADEIRRGAEREAAEAKQAGGKVAGVDSREFKEW